MSVARHARQVEPQQPMNCFQVWRVAAIARAGWRTPRMTLLMQLIRRSRTCVANVSPGQASASLAQRLLPRSRFAELASAGGVIASLCGIAFPFILGSFLDWTNHNYRYTFFFGGGIGITALVLLFVLHGKFMGYGGPKNYAAPDFERPKRPAERP